MPSRGTTTYATFTATLFHKGVFPCYFWDNYCNSQSIKMYLPLARHSIFTATCDLVFRQEELIIEEIVELEGYSPVFSILLSLILPKKLKPHRQDFDLLTPFQYQGRDNPIVYRHYGQAPEPRFELRQRVLETLVLPLHHSGKMVRIKSYREDYSLVIS